MTENRKRNRLSILKLAGVLPAFLVIFCVMAIGAHAYLKWSGEVRNEFTAENSVVPTVNETFENNLKENVSVNPGDTDYSVYVRAAIVVTWMNKNGEVHANIPMEGTDYYLNLNEGSDKDWFEKDGFYYHKEPVESSTDTVNNKTANLIQTCNPLKAAPVDKEDSTDIYTLNVKIVTQTIQSAGMTDGVYDDNGNVVTEPIPAVTAQWGVTVNGDKTISK